MLDSVRANLRRVAVTLVGAFCAIAVGLGYWQVWRAAELADDPLNPRVVEARLTMPRGRILDRNGQVLAVTEDGIRRYSIPSMVHTTGFHSPRFGDTNLEAVYDAELRGERSAVGHRAPAARAAAAARPSGRSRADDRSASARGGGRRALGDASGAVVALDPRSGERPGAGLEALLRPERSDEQLAAVQSRSLTAAVQPRRPGDVRCPGSTFKTVTAAAVRRPRAGRPRAAVQLYDGQSHGRSYSVDCRNSQHIPRLTYEQAFAWSSNRVFGLSGMLLGIRRARSTRGSTTRHPGPTRGNKIAPASVRQRSAPRGLRAALRVRRALPVRPAR